MRNAAIKKGVKADEQGCIYISPAHMTWVGKNGERDITRQPVVLQSWVELMGRLRIILREQNPAGFAQMLKKLEKKPSNTIVESTIQHHQKQWSLWQPKF